MSTTEVIERESAARWLETKLLSHTAGLDPHDKAVLIIEVSDLYERRDQIDAVGHVLEAHPHLRPNGCRCYRVRALIEADIRDRLGLDGPFPPVLRDLSEGQVLAFRNRARDDINSRDVGRRAGKRWN